jgi:basic amino acid/polyamine antiporter, APA family
MAEELAFARKASGLVRGLSLRDCLGIGIAFIGPLYSIWFIEQVGLALYPRANVPLAVIISLVTVGWSAPVVWGILGGTMPRSGGEYVYNSRIIHPAIAMGASFTMLVSAFYWTIFNASMIASPSLAMLGQFMGWQGFADFVSGKAGACIVSIVGLILALAIVIFGMKIYHKLAMFAVVVMLGGVAIMDLALTFSSKAHFIANWNAQAAKYGSLTYDAFVKAAGTANGAPMPTSWTWSDTFGITAGVYMIFVWTFAIAYVAGEVKKPDKTLIKSHVMSIWIPVALCIWAFLALGRIVDFNFLRAASFVDFNYGMDGYTLPYSSHVMGLSYVASGANPLIAFVVSFTFAITLVWLCAGQLIIAQRAFFAWGMDRMGPKWFTSINAKWGSPVGMYLFAFALCVFLVVGYWYLFTDVLTGVIAGGMQVVSTLLVTSIAAIVLPFRKKVSYIWDSSPFNTWKILGIPILAIAGVVYLGYILALIYFSFFDPNTKDITGKKFIILVIVWALGMLWYLVWKIRSSRQGVDVANLTYKELPPE